MSAMQLQLPHNGLAAIRLQGQEQVCVGFLPTAAAACLLRHV